MTAVAWNPQHLLLSVAAEEVSLKKLNKKVHVDLNTKLNRDDNITFIWMDQIVVVSL